MHQASADGQDAISVVTIGHVDHGKSTLIGRLLYETGEIGEGRVEKLRSEARSRDQEESAFAFAMDQFEEERDRLVTIDTRSRHIDIDGRRYHIADAPGHRKWIRNVIMGSLFADAALLVVRADRGPEAQTREHAWLSKRLFGIDQLVVAIEMMDLVGYDQDRFETVVQQVEDVLETVDHAPSDVRFVPTAGYQGDNITVPSDAMDWWTGPTLAGALSRFEQDQPDPGAAPRFLCLEAFRDIQSESVLASGLQLQGRLGSGDRVRFLPSGKTVDVDRIEDMGATREQLRPEDRATIVIDDSDSATDDIEATDLDRGDLAVPMDDPLGPVDGFEAELYVCRDQVQAGDEINVWVYGRTTAGTITEVTDVRDAATQQPQATDTIELGNVATARISLADPVVIQPITETRRNSMFMVMDGERPVGYGNATEVDPA